jgi:hypothetical protein
VDTYGHLFEQAQKEAAEKMDEILDPQRTVEKSEVVVKTVVKPRLLRVK